MTGALGAFAAPCTIFLVVGLGAAVGYEYIVNIGAGSPRPVNMSISQLNGVSQPYYCFDGTAGYSGPVLTDSAWTILAAKHASSATFHYLWKDGAGQVVADYPQALSTNGNYVLGGYAGEILNFTGDVAEVLVYNTALSDTNRGLLEDYLGAKWGITVA